MFALLSDIKFWSCEDNISIEDSDFGAYRYNDKKVEGLHDEGKRSYCNNRGIIYTPVNKKGRKLKDGLKYLEEQLREHTIIYSEWWDPGSLQLMLNTGLLIYIQMKISTADIEKIAFDKYLVGKVPDHLSDAVITREHLVCTQNDSQVVIVHFTKSKRLGLEKISKLEPKITNADLSGPPGRRVEKKVRVNNSGDLILIWWKATSNEVYPWSPAMREHDRANVHLYRLRNAKFELLCYLRTEFDPLCITFNVKKENVIHSIEQKVSRKGEVTIEWQTYQVSQQNKFQRIEVVSIPLPTHTSCAKFSPNQEMLLLCCIDGSIALYDRTRGSNFTVKAGFIPTLASWHNDNFLFTVGNERGQCQHYDISLSCLKTQLLNEDSTPSAVLDLSPYFKSQPALLQISWSRKNDHIFYNDRYKNRDSLFLLSFERGPLAAMRIVEGDNLTGDVLVFKYLSLCSPDRATALLLSMNWDNQPRICMHSLNQILNHLFKLPLSPEHESLIQEALGTFHVPVRPISQAVDDEYGPEVRDLTRRFFHHLLRHKLFEKAFRLAIDLNDHDLFMDIHYYAIVVDDLEMARAAKDKAEAALSRSNSCASSHSTCSRPSCSLCSDSPSDNDSESYSEESGSDSPHRFRPPKFPSQAPPLPIVSSSPFPPHSLMSTSFMEPPSPVPQVQRSPNLRNFPGRPFTRKFETPPKNLPPSSTPQPPVDIATPFLNLRLSESPSRTTRRVYSRPVKRVVVPQRVFPPEIPEINENHQVIDIPNNIEYSFMTLDSNMTSTSFISEEQEHQSSLEIDKPNSWSPDVPTPRTSEDKAQIETEDYSEISRHFFGSENNLVSTSFNEDPDVDVHGNDEIKNSEKNEDDSISIETCHLEVPPPPPEMTSSLANYLSSLPMKNLPILQSTPVLTNMDEFLKIPNRPRGPPVQTQSSVSAILQDRRRINFEKSGTYRFRYDLEIDEGVTYRGFDDLRGSGGGLGGSTGGLRVGEAKRGGFARGRGAKFAKVGGNVPPLPVVNSKGGEGGGGGGGVEKPKVKFSNTVTHILVPGSGQSCRPLQRPVTKLHPMDPKRELAESLPLCLGNEDYLKDFQPLSKDTGGEEKPKDPLKPEPPKIKVVHFGLL